MGEERQKQARHCPWAQMCKQIGTTRGLVNTCWQRHASRGKLIFTNEDQQYFVKKVTLKLNVEWWLGACQGWVGWKGWCTDKASTRAELQSLVGEEWQTLPGARNLGCERCVRMRERGEERGMLLDTRRGEKGVGATFKMFDLKEFRAPYKHRGANDNEL